MKTININSNVRVKLTPFGIEILRKDYEEIRSIAPFLEEFVTPETDSDGYTEMQLWKVMRTFGKYLGLGCVEFPFDLDIRIDENSFEN